MGFPGGALRWLAAAGLLYTSACTDLPPTTTENPLTVPEGRKDIVSVCYATGHSRSDIRAVALEACGKDTVSVTPWRIDEYLNACPVLKKTRVSFLCVKAER